MRNFTKKGDFPLKKYLKNLSKTSIMHYVKLFIRAVFFISALIIYLTGNTEAVCRNGVFPLIVWLWYFAEMISRLFPGKLESMGCEKVFAKNYKPPKVAREPKNQPARTTLAVALAWFALNGAIFALHFIFPNTVDEYVLVLVALAYGICDIICILFFCPFQTWFMKNRCCTTCRIYNWDFAMICTPFLVIPSIYTYSLLFVALIILLRWEITYKRHPERFSERTNESLRCKNCTEKLCKHKVQLQHYIKKNKDLLFEKLEPVVEKLEPAFELIGDHADSIRETISPIEEGIHETYEKVKDKTVETYEKVKDKTVETYEKVKDKTVETYEKVKDKTVETYGKVIDKTVETISAVVDKTMETYERAKELTAETYGKVKDVTTEVYGKVKDTAKELLGIEKQGVEKISTPPTADDTEMDLTAEDESATVQSEADLPTEDESATIQSEADLLTEDESATIQPEDEYIARPAEVLGTPSDDMDDNR